MFSARFSVGIALSAISAARLGHGNPTGHLAYRSVFDIDVSETCPTTSQLSCHNTTVQTNLCCFNAPGGSLLQTQFWDTDPVTGPDDSWTIHGLWPDNCDGTYVEDCDSSRDYTDITQILTAAGETALIEYMDTYWQSNDESGEEFWEHEWSTHGTCISTLDPSCYTNYETGDEVVDFFTTVVALFKTLPTYTWLSDAGITPSSTTTYTSAAIQAALTENHGASVYLGCDDDELYQVYYYFNVKGSVQTGTFVAAASQSSSNCPSTGVKYLPKSGGSSGGGGDGSGGGGVFSGTGYLNVVSGGSQNGCLISDGNWYTTGTCATYTATASGTGFTLTSSKGNCGISTGVFSCSSSAASTEFTADGSDLQASGSALFSTDSVPTGSTQATVYTGSTHSVAMTIEWEKIYA
ncbi:hypothetical protein SUNI508_06636 [Seiridium unicorne]|uniref:Ribonuclease T2-like n=1 Tax=Seiridium unicorne TaxID=138068 RepID=A0ABR2UZI7_9PEZI